MKRLTSILAISVIAVMSAGAARADIASTTYVDTKAAANAKEIAKKENVANKVVSGGDMEAALKAADADTKYPTLKAALEVAQVAAGAATAELGTLASKDSVSNALIDANAVTSDKIANGTITNDDIATNAAIAQSKIAGLAASIADAKSAGTAATTALNDYKTSNDAAVAKKADSATMTTELAKKENTTNKVTAISSTSTDTQYPSAKAVYTELAKKQNNITIDSALSSDSTNPVQNKVVNTALAGKLGKTENAVSATKATQDGNGNTITTTYATKTELGTKQNKLVSDGANANISGSNGVTVTVGTDGKIAVSGNQTAIDTAIANAKKAGTDAASELSTYKTSNDAAVAKKADSATMTTELAKKENTTNKVTAISSTSTDTQYPSAKAVYTELAKKQNNLNTDQLAAVNSKITATKVTTYDGYSAKITAAQNTANAAIAAPAANTISTDGLYTLTMKVVDGTKTYAWEKIGR